MTINSLGEMGTIQKIKEALESLPNGLDEIYTRSLDEIKHHKSDAIRILQLLLFSPIPLREEYVLDATSIDLEALPGYGIDPMRRVNSFDKLSSLMSTFIRKSGYYGKLQIAHSSVRDYLLYTGPGSPPRYRLREISAKATVVGVCLGYIDSILTHAAPSGPEIRQRSFISDADQIWRTLSREQECQTQIRANRIEKVVALNHVYNLQERSVQEEAYSYILKFLIHNGSKLQHRTSFYLGKMYGGPPLYVASTIGLTRIVGELLNAGVRADEKGGIDGFAEAVALPNSFYKNLLDRFGIEEHEEIKEGPGSGPGYGSALVAACHEGHDSIVQMLLGSKVEVNGHEGSSYGSPLQAACYNKHKAIVEMLLKKDVDVNRGGKPPVYPLSVACESGSLEIVKLLLDKGADLNVGNPLSAACQSGNPEIVQLLLDKGANVNAQEGHRGTALGMACQRGHKGVVRVLLANGADPNAGEDFSGRPLQLACSQTSEREAIVKMLLEHGANVNAKASRFGTALHAAVENRLIQSIKLLLDAGADVHIAAGRRGTILEAACFSTSEEAFRLLVEAGANPNSPSPGRGRIMKLAISNARPYIVRYLLETGVGLADLDGFTCREQEYVFRIARESCNEVVLQRLGIRKVSEERIHRADQSPDGSDLLR